MSLAGVCDLTQASSSTHQGRRDFIILRTKAAGPLSAQS